MRCVLRMVSTNARGLFLLQRGVELVRMPLQRLVSAIGTCEERLGPKLVATAIRSSTSAQTTCSCDAH